MSGGWLLDTSVLSAFAPGKPDIPVDLAQWLRAHSTQLFIPCIAVAELEQGICKLRRAGGAKRAELLAQWLDGLVQDFAKRVLPLDAASSRIAGQIADDAVAAGRHPGFTDVAIAALARQNGLTVLTRNLKHFGPLGVDCADPFERLPG